MTTSHWVGIAGVIAIAIAATAVIYQLNAGKSGHNVTSTITNLGGTALKNLYK